MTRKSVVFFIAALLFTAVFQENAIAQKDKYRDKANDPVAKLGYEKKLRWADGLFSSGSYFNAVDYYSQLLEEQPRNPYLNYQIAECYYFLRDYIPAAEFYGRTYGMASAVYPESVYKEAIMLKMSGEYDRAVTRFQKFIDDNPKTYKNLKKRAQTEIEGCLMAKESMSNPIPATIKNAGANINTAYTELAPYPLGDTALLFATMKSNQLVDANKEKRADYVSRFMVARKAKYATGDRDTFEWPLDFLDGQFNDSRFHVGNGVFSPGGDRFYFTKCLENDTNAMMCRIFVSEFESTNSKWTAPKELGNEINIKGSSSTQPFIAKVGKNEILFFASNRTLQSRGGYDIWYSVYDTRQKSYRRPQNVGKQINTVGDEMSPYYDSRTGTLYFASNGWITMGGFDIFSAKGGPSRYTDLSNLGYPINTSADELYYIHDPMGKPDAYVVSNRMGSVALKNPTCCDDIWRIQYEPKIYALGKVLDQRTQEEVAEIAVKLVDESGNLRTFNSKDGEFEFLVGRGHNFVITADKVGYTSTRALVNTEAIERHHPDDTVKVTIYVNEIRMDSSFVLKDVLYDFNEATLRPSSAATLEKLIEFMSDNPSLDVEIHSHTDDKGTDQYNLNLSHRRAESVVEYLVRGGVERHRLTPKGIGKSSPKVPNTSEENRQINRRTEFKIVTDVPTRRVIYDSSQPGTIGEQARNLEVPEDNYEYDNADSDSQYGTPGSRVNR